MYGAGSLGASLAEQIKATYADRTILGFIDDDPALAHMSIHGFEVLGDRTVAAEDRRPARAHRSDRHRDLGDLRQAAAPDRRAVPAVLAERAGGARPRRAVPGEGQASATCATCRSRTCSAASPPSSSLDAEQLQAFLGGKTILVTGAGGSIGSELCFQILKFRPKKLILFGRGENSIYATKHRLLPHAEGVELEEVIGDIINYSKVDAIFAHAPPRSGVPCRGRQARAR